MKLRKIPPLADIYNQRCFGAGMGQTWTALLAFEWILNSFPFCQIIEFGTGQGGLSLFLYYQAEIREMRFYTFDKQNRLGIPVGGENKEPVENRPEITLSRMRDCFSVVDIFNAKVVPIIIDMLKDGPALVYCDNGAKPRELKTYAPLCLPGSVIGVHDWHRPHFGDLEKFEKDNNLEVIYSEFCDKHKTRQRFWYKGE